MYHWQLPVELQKSVSAVTTLSASSGTFLVKVTFLVRHFVVLVHLAKNQANDTLKLANL